MKAPDFDNTILVICTRMTSMTTALVHCDKQGLFYERGDLFVRAGTCQRGLILKSILTKVPLESQPSH